MNMLKLLGTGLIKKEKKKKSEVKHSGEKKCTRRTKRAASVEMFLREILGTHLIQIEKKF